MLDLNECIEEIIAEYEITDPDFKLEFTRHLVNNNWFGLNPEIKDETVLIDESIRKHIETFCRFYGTSIEDKLNEIMTRLSNALPDTASDFNRYIQKKDIDNNTIYAVADFLLYYLAGELYLADDNEVSYYMEDAFDNLSKANGDVFADFINWTKHTRKKKVAYKNDYFMNARKKQDTSAYSMSDYLNILYHMFNAEYIDEKDMYRKAAQAKNYADTWLFISLHFVCALRNTDLFRITHPKLPDTPENVLQSIIDGTFSETDAKMTLYSIMWRLNALMLKPNKTKRYNVPSIKLHIPESLEAHFGTLFAIAEAHYQINNSEGSLVREISTYQQITKYMGEEIGNLFLYSNFSSRAANKSFMQMIEMMTSDILGKDEFNTKGYILAAFARSHKGSYGEFAKSTVTYLRDAKMNGYTPEFVARELFERGVLSFIPSLALKMITRGGYNDLSPENQTKLIKSFNMSPLEIERAVMVAQETERRSGEIVRELYSSETKEDILNILHRIGNGEAVSKQDECLCLITAMKKLCPYNDRRSCIGCQYEISTKSTLFMMMSEFKRLKSLYNETDNPINKQKYKTLLTEIVAPAMSELIECVGEMYGNEAKLSLEEIIDRMANE